MPSLVSTGSERLDLRQFTLLRAAFVFKDKVLFLPPEAWKPLSYSLESCAPVHRTLALCAWVLLGPTGAPRSFSSLFLDEFAVLI